MDFLKIIYLKEVNRNLCKRRKFYKQLIEECEAFIKLRKYTFEQYNNVYLKNNIEVWKLNA